MPSTPSAGNRLSTSLAWPDGIQAYALRVVQSPPPAAADEAAQKACRAGQVIAPPDIGRRRDRQPAWPATPWHSPCAREAARIATRRYQPSGSPRKPPASRAAAARARAKTRRTRPRTPPAVAIVQTAPRAPLDSLEPPPSPPVAIYRRQCRTPRPTTHRAPARQPPRARSPRPGYLPLPAAIHIPAGPAASAGTGTHCRAQRPPTQARQSRLRSCHLH